MDDLLAESQRLEDEARRLAGMATRHRAPGAPDDEPQDSIAAILRDAGQQLRDAGEQLLDAAEEGAREVRRRVRGEP